MQATTQGGPACATVDGAIYTNDVDQDLLGAHWQDPDFDPSQRAFYYVRVLEIPTPTWSAYDKAFYGDQIKLPEDALMVHQERAYTSPIGCTPKEMIARDWRLPNKLTGGLRNPLGARALYLGKSLYRIHGTNDTKSIGRAASSGCFRMMNEHVVHLASMVGVGTPVTVVKRMPPMAKRVSPPPPLPLRNAAAQL